MYRCLIPLPLLPLKASRMFKEMFYVSTIKNVWKLRLKGIGIILLAFVAIFFILQGAHLIDGLSKIQSLASSGSLRPNSARLIEGGRGLPNHSTFMTKVPKPEMAWPAYSCPRPVSLALIGEDFMRSSERREERR
jgi:hypothetical protein